MKALLWFKQRPSQYRILVYCLLLAIALVLVRFIRLTILLNHDLL